MALDWGMIDFERNEHDRPDYQGDVITSFIDGSPMRYFPSNEQNRRLCLSVVSIVGLVLLVTGVVVGIYLMRYFLAASDGGPLSDSDAQTLASICNAVQIQVMNYIYTFIANALTENERHRTQTQFEDSMIAKIFLFQFVNSYASFFYLAFIAEFVGDCDGEECMSSLAINLAIIFGTRLASGYITGIVLPYVTYQMKYRKTVEKSAGKISRPEREFLLQPVRLCLCHHSLRRCLSLSVHVVSPLPHLTVVLVSCCGPRIYSMTCNRRPWATTPMPRFNSDTCRSSSRRCRWPPSSRTFRTSSAFVRTGGNCSICTNVRFRKEPKTLAIGK